MHHHHRFAPLAAPAIAALLLATTSGAAHAATPPASFMTPSTGTTGVVAANTRFTAQWTELSGSGITDRSVAVQAARPRGQLGCDTRWIPAGTATVAGTTAVSPPLADGRCYRFALSGTTPTGPFTIISAPIVASAAAIGPDLAFTNPIRAGLVVYEPTNVITWLEGDSFALPLVGRSFVEQSAPSADGNCASASNWRGSAIGSVTIGRVVRTLSRGYCYRFSATLTDGAGFSRTWTSETVYVAPALRAWTGKADLYRASAFASQATGTWCVAASSQMMINLITGTSDTSAATQSTYIAYAQAHDAADYPVGSDPAGWAATLNRYGGGPYTFSRYGDRTNAIKAAAKRLRLSNKPVGLLVAAGGHAWVMTGFTATADPATTDSFTVTSVYASGPLWPRPTNSYGYDLAPDTQISMTTFAKYFTPYQDWRETGWNGYYVIVNP